MTTEEKAKAYDEALKIARCWLNDPQTIQDCNYTIEDAIQNIFPQLRESENERIRKWLADYFSSIKKTVWIHRDITCEQILDWLEKQKEQDKEEPKIAFGSWGDKEKQEAVITLIKYARWIKKITNEECKDLVQWFENNIVFNVLEKDGWTISCEQTDTIKEDYYGAFLRGEMRGYMRAKREEQKCPEFCNGHCVGCEQKEQKPAEWSEEDERMLDSAIHIITHVDDLAHEPTFAGPKWTHPYTKEIAWLKSLRPSWKPSEEQMAGLLVAIGDEKERGSDVAKTLRSLYEQLKKL